MKNLLTILLDAVESGFFGSYSPSFFLQCACFAIIGFYLTTVTNVARRNPLKEGTPTTFDFKTFIKKNGKRIATNIACIYLGLRFFPDIFGTPLTHIKAVLAGASCDFVLIFISKFRKNLKK